MKVNSLISLFKNRKGTVFIEAAFILPIFLLLCLAGTNISLYLISVSTSNKTADLLANTLSTAERYTNTADDFAAITADGQLKYLTQESLGRLIHDVVPAMMNGTAATTRARVIVTSYRKQLATPPSESWQCVYDFPAAAARTACSRVATPNPLFGGSIVTPARTAIANMLDGEGMIVVEVYQRFVPPIGGFNLPVVGAIPMLTENTIYASAAYPARSGPLHCLYPLPYAGGC